MLRIPLEVQNMENMLLEKTIVYRDCPQSEISIQIWLSKRKWKKMTKIMSQLLLESKMSLRRSICYSVYKSVIVADTLIVGDTDFLKLAEFNHIYQV